MSFSQFSFPPFVAKSLLALKFETPTPIQRQAIPIALTGRDLMGLAQTGTGKTAAFCLPLIARLSSQPQQTGLIVAPTRELAQQICTFVHQVAGKGAGLQTALLVGGAPMGPQFRSLRQGARILVATPGRLADHLRRDTKLLRQTTIFVVDEADRMLDMGFLPQLQVILKALPEERQTMMFSATFAPGVKRLAQQYLRQPAEVSVGETGRPIEKIELTTVETPQAEKNDRLLTELNARPGSVLIFTRTKHRTDRLNQFLEEYGYAVTRIHGDRTLAQRRSAIEGFRSGKFRILVATDIVARGIDIADISLVINFDLPQAAEDYLHRIGRTGRNGKVGRALCFVTPEDRGTWRAITRLISGGQGAQSALGPQGPRRPRPAAPKKFSPRRKPQFKSRSTHSPMH